MSNITWQDVSSAHGLLNCVYQGAWNFLPPTMRKARLVGVACLRFMRATPNRETVELLNALELYEDGHIGQGCLIDKLMGFGYARAGRSNLMSALEALAWRPSLDMRIMMTKNLPAAFRALRMEGQPESLQCQVIRDIFHPDIPSTAGLPRDLALGNATYQERDEVACPACKGSGSASPNILCPRCGGQQTMTSPVLMSSNIGILRDYMMDCDYPQVMIDHLSYGRHVRGCWVVDAFLGYK